MGFRSSLHSRCPSPTFWRGLLALVPIFALAWTAVARAGPETDGRVTVELHTLDHTQPLQDRLGYAETSNPGGDADALGKVEKWIAKAEATIRESGKPVTDARVKKWLTEYLNKRGERIVRGFRDPDGIIRADDAHHSIKAAKIVMKRYGIKDEDVTFLFDVRLDYEGKSWEEYAAALKRLGVGNFSPEYLRRAARYGWSPGEMLRHLPDWDHLTNDPARSALGHLYDSLGVKGYNLVAYSQFRIEDELLDKWNVKIRSGTEMSDAVLLKLEALLFGPEHGREFREFVISMALPGKKRLARAALDAAKARYEEYAKVGGTPPRMPAKYCLGQAVGPLD